MPSRKPYRLVVRPLEDRVVPATWLGFFAVSYQDVDGDMVTVRSNRPIFDQASLEQVFTFDNGFRADDNTVGQQLQTIDLTKLTSPRPAGTVGPAGINLTVTAEPGRYPGQDGWHRQKGDGRANVGFINAAADLNSVDVDGDLGGINAGDATSSTPGLGTLKVHSLGVLGSSTQAAGTPTISQVTGALKTLDVAGDVAGVYLLVTGAAAADGQIGTAKIGGSLVGGSQNSTGLIWATGNVGDVTISGNVIGGGGTNSGMLYAGGFLKKVTVKGSVVGGTQDVSGVVSAANGIGTAAVGGNLVGGSGARSGQLVADTGYNTVTVGGSVIGGAGAGSGRVWGSQVTQRLSVGGDVQGGIGVGSGVLQFTTLAKAVEVKGSVSGGTGDASGGFYLGTSLDPPNSPGVLGSVTIGGDLRGGGGKRSGNVETYRSGLDVQVKGSVVGGGGESSGQVYAVGEAIRSITVNRDVVAGAGQSSGGLYANSALKVKVGGSVRGFPTVQSGFIRGGFLPEVAIDGSLLAADVSAFVVAGATVPPQIGRLSVAGRAEYALVSAQGTDASITSLKVGGDWVASNATATRSIGLVDVQGQVLGTPDTTGDSFSFSAGQVIALAVHNKFVPLTAGPGNNNKVVSVTGDVTVAETGAPAEVAPTFPTTFTFTPTTVKYRDVDGDDVTVTLSKPLITSGNVNTAFTFVQGPNGGLQLQMLDLHPLARNFGTVTQDLKGLTVTVKAEPNKTGGGDGFVNVGYITGGGAVLSQIDVDGDLGRAAAGGSTTGYGLGTLHAHSIGRLGLSTQPAGNANLNSTFICGLGQLRVDQDVVGAHLTAFSGQLNGYGLIALGGSLIGGTADDSGVIEADRPFGLTLINLDVQGGSGAGSGRLSATGSGALGAMKVLAGGSLVGGKVEAGGDLGMIAGDNLIGGEVAAGGKLSAVVNGSVLGGTLHAAAGIVNLAIGRDLVGTAADFSGRVYTTAGGMDQVTVTGSVVGGAGADSGRILSAGNVKNRITVGLDVRGGAGARSGAVEGQGATTAAVNVGGSVVGGAGDFSGRIRGGSFVGQVGIVHDLIGGSATDASSDAAGSVQASNIAKVLVGGSVITGTHTGTGALTRSGSIIADSGVGAIGVLGEVRGNPSQRAILAGGSGIERVAVGGGVAYADVLAGYNGGNVVPTIGLVAVVGDWVASNLVAGVDAGADGFYGTADDALSANDDPGTRATIGQVVIGGQAVGTGAGGDHFGIVAEEVKAVTVNKVKQGLARYPQFGLIPGPGNDDAPVGGSGDLSIREVPV